MLEALVLGPHHLLEAVVVVPVVLVEMHLQIRPHMALVVMVVLVFKFLLLDHLQIHNQ
tara:strand:+ start:95 stop:268 length:174 start_codon:yes stop_codon:yes gene_type:complete